VRRKAPAAALHPNTRSNSTTRERLTEPVADRINLATTTVGVGRAAVAVTVGAGNNPLNL
jgi:hypothetical protein